MLHFTKEYFIHISNGTDKSYKKVHVAITFKAEVHK